MSRGNNGEGGEIGCFARFSFLYDLVDAAAVVEDHDFIASPSLSGRQLGRCDERHCLRNVSMVAERATGVATRGEGARGAGAGRKNANRNNMQGACSDELAALVPTKRKTLISPVRRRKTLTSRHPAVTDE